MKRRLLFLAFVLSTVVGWSQTVTLKFKNGTTQQYNMSELESIDFKDGDNNNSGNDDAEVEITEANLVGVWELVSYDFNYAQATGVDYKMKIKEGDKMTILPEGVCYYSFTDEEFKWLLNGKQISITYANPKEWSIPTVYWITKLTSKEMLLYLNYSSFNATLKFKRVS
jgi:hypothetical protein